MMSYLQRPPPISAPLLSFDESTEEEDVFHSIYFPMSSAPPAPCTPSSPPFCPCPSPPFYVSPPSVTNDPTAPLPSPSPPPFQSPIRIQYFTNTASFPSETPFSSLSNTLNETEDESKSKTKSKTKTKLARFWYVLGAITAPILIVIAILMIV
jgi:hypothetical protein